MSQPESELDDPQVEPATPVTSIKVETTPKSTLVGSRRSPRSVTRLVGAKTPKMDSQSPLADDGLCCTSFDEVKNFVSNILQNAVDGLEVPSIADGIYEKLSASRRKSSLGVLAKELNSVDQKKLVSIPLTSESTVKMATTILAHSAQFQRLKGRLWRLRAEKTARRGGSGFSVTHAVSGFTPNVMEYKMSQFLTLMKGISVRTVEKGAKDDERVPNAFDCLNQVHTNIAEELHSRLPADKGAASFVVLKRLLKGKSETDRLQSSLNLLHTEYLEKVKDTTSEIWKEYSEKCLLKLKDAADVVLKQSLEEFRKTFPDIDVSVDSDVVGDLNVPNLPY